MMPEGWSGYIPPDTDSRILPREIAQELYAEELRQAVTDIGGKTDFVFWIMAALVTAGVAAAFKELWFLAASPIFLCLAARDIRNQRRRFAHYHRMQDVLRSVGEANTENRIVK